MGRKIPSDANSQLHPALPLPLLITCVAAIVAVVAALCGTRIRKHSSAAKTARQSEDKASVATSTTKATVTMGSGKGLVQEQDVQHQMNKEQHTIEPHEIDVPDKLLYPLPLPAGGMPGQKVSPMNKSASTRHLRVSLSMKLPSLSRIRTGREREKNGDECIWKKTIILGERCRVPGDDDEEGAIYDGKGNRIVAYAPRTPRSLPVSRTTSFIDTDAIPRRNS